MGLLSQLINPITSYYEGKQRLAGAKAGANAMNQAYAKSNDLANQGYSATKTAYSPYTSAGSSATSQLSQLLSDPSQYQTQDFSYSGKLSDFLDPYMQTDLKNQIQAQDQSAASRGGLFDTGYQKQLAGYTNDLTGKYVSQAQQNMLADRSQALQEHTSNIEQSRANRAQRLQGLQGLMDTGMSATGAVNQAGQNYYNTAGNNALAQGNMNANLAALQQQSKGSFGTALAKSLAGLGDAGLDYISGNGGLSSLLGSINQGGGTTLGSGADFYNYGNGKTAYGARF